MNDSDLLKNAAEIANQTPLPPSRAIPYGPVPMAWNVSQAQSPEGLVIILTIQTPEGDKVFFLQPDYGKKLGDALIKLSSAADSGLIVPQ